MNGFKGLDLGNSVPEELWTEVRNIVQEAVNKTIPKKQESKKAKWFLKEGRLSLSCVQLFATPWIAAYQAPPSMGFSRQEYRSGLPFPSPGELLNPGIEPRSPTLQTEALTSEPPGRQQGVSVF